MTSSRAQSTATTTTNTSSTTSTSTSSSTSSTYNSSYAGFSATSVPEFVKMLNKLPKDNTYFADSHYYSNGKGLRYQPGMYEIIAHLKLIKAFQALKHNVVSHAHAYTNGDGPYLWNAFIHNSIRRFITFASALKHKCTPPASSGISRNEDSKFFAKTPKNPSMSLVLSSTLPPIDILLIWYSLLTNSQVCYDIFARYNFLEFMFHPFPLSLINASIKNDDFSYIPQQLYKNNFYDLMALFNCNLNYDLVDMFNPEEIYVPVKCPNCDLVLHDKVPLCRAKSKSGFIDENFKIDLSARNCKCGFSPIITHDSLRIRQLYCDLSSGKTPVPNVYKVASKFFVKDSHIPVAELNKELKTFSFDKTETDLSKIVHHLKLIVNDNPTTTSYVDCLNDYSSIDLMHLTITKPDLIQLSTDVKSIVSSKFHFLKKVNTFDVLHSENLETTLTNSINRYLNFWSLIKSSATERKGKHTFEMGQLIPTIDIDLIWLTHKLSFHYYYNWSLFRIDQFVDRNEVVNRQLSDKFFESTALLYKQSFHDDFTNCPCRLCSTIKTKQNDKFSKKFSSKHDSNDYVVSQRNTNVGLTHISRFNSSGDSTDKIVERVKTYYDDMNKKKFRYSKYASTNKHSISNLSNITGYCI